MLIALGIAATVFLALLGLREFVVRRLGKRAERTANGLDDLVVSLGRRTQLLVIAVVALYFGSLYVTLQPRQEKTLRGLAEVAVFLQIALWSSVAIDFWLARQRRRMDQDPTSVALAGVLRFVAKLILWALLLLMALDNLGVNVTALITGLGVGGVAVALALQNVLSDLLASLSIVLDKPFVIGDAITVDDPDRHGREHRPQDHPPARRLGRAARLRQQRPAQEPHPQLAADGRAPGRPRLRRPPGHSAGRRRAHPRA